MASAISQLAASGRTAFKKSFTSAKRITHPSIRPAAQVAVAGARVTQASCHSSAAGSPTMTSETLLKSTPFISSSIPRRGLRSWFLVASTIATTVMFAGVGAAFSSENGDTSGPKNVLGQELEICSTDPMTGYFRQGRCETGPTDVGTHTVCAKVTKEFLEYTMAQGNDLVTPRPEYKFPGLKPGNGWCLCASRWREALKAGVAPPIVLGATHEKTLQYVDMASLKKHDASPGGSAEF